MVCELLPQGGQWVLFHVYFATVLLHLLLRFAACAEVLQSLRQEWMQRTFFSDQEQIEYMCGLSLACRSMSARRFWWKICRFCQWMHPLQR